MKYIVFLKAFLKIYNEIYCIPESIFENLNFEKIMKDYPACN